MTYTSKDQAEMLALAEELREFTAFKYAGDCKCGKCQLVPREFIDRLYAALLRLSAQAPQPGDGARGAPPFCTCPCSCDETPHDGSRCALHDTVTDWEDVENHVERQKPHASPQQPACDGARECDCGFSAEVCRGNHCYRKQIATSGLVPDAKWPNTGRAALQQPDAAGDGEPVAWLSSDGVSHQTRQSPMFG